MPTNEQGITVQRQYIGARYVPKFFQGPDGTPAWVDNVPYEPLTIVTYLGNSYTSKIPVPPGIGSPANNPTYWALTGAHNAQIEQYQQQVENYKQIANNTAQELQTEITARENADNTLYNKINKNAIYIGNSYTGGTGSTTSKGLFALTKNLFNNAYMYIGSGSGFLITEQSTETFIDLLNKAGNDNRQNITDIIVLSAIGDARALHEGKTVAQFKAAFSNFMSTATDIFPNAKVSIALCDTRKQGEINSQTNFFDEFRAYEMFKKCAPQFGFNFIGWIGWITTNLNNDYWSDGYHPNDDGYNILANQFIKAFTSGINYDNKFELYRYNGTNRVWLSGTPDMTIILPSNLPAMTLGPSTVWIDFTKSRICPAFSGNSDSDIQNVIITNSDSTQVQMHIAPINNCIQLAATGIGEIKNQAWASGPFIVPHYSGLGWI